MGKIIAWLNPKGGAGKTTSCVNVARVVQLLGYSVVILDTDPQASALCWRRAGGEESVQPEVIHHPHNDVHLIAEKLAKDNDFVFIDGAAVARDITISGILAASNPDNPGLILVPFGTGSVDAWGSFHLLEFIQKRRSEGAPVNAFMFLSRQHPQENRQKDSANAAKELGSAFDIPIMKNMITRFMDYEDSQGMGCSVIELNKRGKAAEQVQGFTQEIMEIMV